jgi:hypothetical protein
VFASSRLDQAVRRWFLVCYDWLRGLLLVRLRRIEYPRDHIVSH